MMNNPIPGTEGEERYRTRRGACRYLWKIGWGEVIQTVKEVTVCKCI